MPFARQVLMGGLLAVTVLLGPAVAVAQTIGLPPLAQAAVDRGLADARRQDFARAKDDFREAWHNAPDTPQIWYYLGLSEAKLPGYELRSIAWFKLYLLKVPDASNADAIRTQIAGLEAVFEGRISTIADQLEPLLMIDKGRHFPGTAPDVLDTIHQNQIEIGWDLAAARFAIGDVAGAQRGLERTNGHEWQRVWEEEGRVAVGWHGPPGSLLPGSQASPDAPLSLFTAMAAAGLLRQDVDMVGETNPNIGVTDKPDSLYDEDPVAFFLEQGDVADARRLAADPMAARVVIVCSPDALAQAWSDPEWMAHDRCRDNLWWSEGRAAFLLKTAVNGIRLSLGVDDVHMVDYVRSEELADPAGDGLESVASAMRRLALEYRKVRGPSVTAH